MGWKITACVLLASTLVFGAVGCGSQSGSTGFGSFTLTSVGPSPAPAATAVTITGGDFSNMIDTQVVVKWCAPAGTTPFLGGTSNEVTSVGTITSATTIDTITPHAVICGPATLNLVVKVTMPSGAWGSSVAPIFSLAAPTMTSFAGGDVFPAAIPTPFTINGTGYSDIGSPVTIHWRTTPAGAGPTIFNQGAAMTIETGGLVASATTITGTSPEAAVCGPVNAPAEVYRISFRDGSCTPMGSSLPATFVAPTITSIVNSEAGGALNGTNDFDSARPVDYTITGTGYGPTGGTAQVTFTAPAGTPFNGGTSATVTVPGTIANATTITGTSPAAVVCGIASVSANVKVTVPHGSCTPAPVVTDFLAPTFVQIENLSTVGPHAGTAAPGEFAAAVPEPFRITGTGFGPVGGTAFVRWQNNAGGLPTPYQAGTSNTVLVPATILSDTTIEGISPAASFCSPTLPNGAGQSHLVTLPDGSCTLDSGFATILWPPRVTAITGPFESTNPSSFTLTGEDFGPVGGVAAVTFLSTSGIPNSTPFAGGTSAAGTVTGLITSRTTIEGTSPEATIKVVFDAGVGTNCVSASASCDVDVVLEGGSCNPATLPPLLATINGPLLASINGGPTAQAPSTILLNETDPTAFTIVGTGFGPPGSTCLVEFEDTLGQGLFDGGASTAFVSGLVVDTTTVTGSLPTITAAPAGPNTNAGRLAIDLSCRVEVDFFNGSESYCNNAINFVAPPTISDVAAALRVREGGTRAFLTRCSTRLTVTGTEFDALLAATSVLVEGTTTLVGTGNLGDPTLAATTIFGDSPVDSTINTKTQYKVRVVNPDNQYHDFTAPDCEYLPLGHHQNQDVTPNVGQNSEPECAIDPTDPTNMAILVHNNGNEAVAWTTNGGATWTQTLVGTGADTDPRIAYDRFGTLYVCMFTLAGPRTCFVQQSFDNGATFGPLITVAVDPLVGMDKEFFVIGPDGNNPAQDALYVGWTDNAGNFGPPQSIVVRGAVTTGAALAATAFTANPVVQVSDNVDNYDWCNATVGPNGDLHVVFHGNTGNNTGPLTVYYDRNPLGLFAGGGFGADVVVDTTNVGSFEPIPATPLRTIFPNSEVAVVQNGTLAGRVVVCFGDEIPNNSDDVDSIVRYSDNNGTTWSSRVIVNNDVTTTSQFFCSLREDPVSGALATAWYDCRADVTNNRRVQVFASMSFDGGATWEPNMLVSDGTSDQALMVSATEYLDYLGLRLYDGCAFVSWSDNSNSALPANPDGTAFTDAYVSRFQFR